MVGSGIGKVAHKLLSLELFVIAGSECHVLKFNTHTNTALDLCKETSRVRSHQVPGTVLLGWSQMQELRACGLLRALLQNNRNQQAK